MKLTPHIKALLDDLISISKGITIKRTDIATANEGDIEESNLYHQYLRVIENDVSYYSYSSFPQEVLESILYWNKTNNYINLTVTPEESIRSSYDGKNTVTVSKNEPPNNIDSYKNGDIWVVQKNIGKYLRLYKQKSVRRNFSNTVIDINGNEIDTSTNISMSGNNFIFNDIKFYVYDNKISKYVEVNYHFNDIFIKHDEIDKYFDYLFDVDSDGNNVRYKIDDVYNYYSVDVDETEPNYYVRKYYSGYSIADSKYKKDPYIYLPITSEIPYYCTKTDDEKYYLLDEDDGIYVKESEMPEYIDITTKTPYYEYKSSKANDIDFDEKYIVAGEELKRYSNKIYYSYDGALTVRECSTKIDIVEKVNLYYPYFVENTNGKYVYDSESDTYKKVENNGTHEMKVMFVPIPYVKNSEGEYIEEELENIIDWSNVYIYIHGDIIVYEADRLFSDNVVNNINNGTYIMNDTEKDIVLSKMNNYIKNKYCPYYGDSRWAVTRYDGETNTYYRELNGLPPKYTNIEQPRINRYEINPYYEGKDTNPYLYDLSDDEIDIIENNGILDKYKSLNPTKGYLWHLGRNRIDTLVARDAAPFDILHVGKFDNEASYFIFKDAYKVSRNYILNKYYQPEMFDVNPYYGSYIGFIILVNALNICMAQSGEILTHNKYSDYETVQLKLSSFGFDHIFDSIPLIYRKNIARNIELLIRNKGIDDIYDIVYKIFNIDDVEIYKYYFRRIWKTNSDGEYITDENGNPVYELSIAQVPLKSNNIVSDVTDNTNILSYDEITESDRYWGVYQSNESVKELLKNYNFNYMNSKYVTLNNRFSLSELNFNSSYLLNYISECIKDKFYLDIDGFDDEQDLKNLIIMLFAIQSIKFGFDGNIPNDLISTAALMKFNVNSEITGSGDNVTILDIINDYYDKLSINAYDSSDELSGRDKANILRKLIEDVGAIITPKINQSSIYTTILDQISDAYLKNLTDDDSLTIFDESSFYKRIIKYRNEANTINDYMCFNDLLKCVAVSDMIKDVYKIDTTWELLYESIATSTDGINLNIISDTEKWHYINMNYIWTKINNTNTYDDFVVYLSDNRYINYDGTLTKDESGDFKILSDNTIYISYKKPALNELIVNDYNYAININNLSKLELETVNFYDLSSTEIDVYIKETILPTKLPTSKEEKIILSGNKLIINSESIETYTESQQTSDSIGTYYMEIVETENKNYSIKLYQYLDTALTYQMYLKYQAKDLYDYLQQRVAEDSNTYRNRLDEIFSIIITSIESAITNNSIREKLNLHFNDFSNISKYIKTVIEVFKSYTIDLASMDSIYYIDDNELNRIKTIDSLAIEDNSAFNENIHIYSDMFFDELMSISDVMHVRDEIVIEEINE